MAIQARGYAALQPGTTLTPWDFQRRDVDEYDVQLDILFCGVCHSDLHQIRNDWFPGIFPMVPGHEIVGRVARVGKSVKKFKPGDLAAVGCLVDSCRTCENCLGGMEQYCLTGPVGTYNDRDKTGAPTYGGYSNSIVVHEDFVLRLAGSQDLAAVAPLLCAGITTWSPLRHWKVGAGHRLAVLGLGGLGHMAVKFGVAFGADVTVLSSTPAKEEDARRLGAHHFINTRDTGAMKKARRTFDFVIDTVSATHDLKPYLALLRLDGTHILVGLPSEPIAIPPFSLTNGRRRVAGSSIGGIPETQEMLDYCFEHNIACDVEVIDIRNIGEAYQRMERGDVRYRFVIDVKSLEQPLT